MSTTGTAVRLRVLPALLPVNGRDVEIRGTDTAIEERLAGDTDWNVIVEYSTLTDPILAQAQAAADAATQQANDAAAGIAASTQAATDAATSAIGASTDAVAAAASADADAVQTAADRVASGNNASSALNSKTAAESAASASLVAAGPIYADEATGRAAVADGAQFSNLSADLFFVEKRQRVNSGSSTLLFTYPSKAFIELINQIVREAVEVQTQYEYGTSGVIPILASSNQIMVGADEGGRLVADISSLLGDAYGDNDARATIAGNVTPIILSANNKVLLGFDTDKDSLVGALPGATSLAQYPTVGRPADGSFDVIYDTTIGRPMFWNRMASTWADADGNVALPRLYDDFSVKANGPIGNAATGQPWVTIPNGVNPYVVQPAVSSGALIAPDSGDIRTAAYWGINNGQTIRSMYMDLCWGAGSGEGSGVLISNPNGIGAVTDITNGSIHGTFTNTRMLMGYFSAGVLTVLGADGNPNGAGVPYTNVPLLDGTTFYRVGWTMVGNRFFFLLPGGQTLDFVSAPLAAAGGPFGFFEHFWEGSTRPRPRVRKVSIN